MGNSLDPLQKRIEVSVATDLRDQEETATPRDPSDHCGAWNWNGGRDGRRERREMRRREISTQASRSPSPSLSPSLFSPLSASLLLQNHSLTNPLLIIYFSQEFRSPKQTQISRGQYTSHPCLTLVLFGQVPAITQFPYRFSLHPLPACLY